MGKGSDLYSQMIRTNKKKFDEGMDRIFGDPEREAFEAINESDTYEEAHANYRCRICGCPNPSRCDAAYKQDTE